MESSLHPTAPRLEDPETSKALFKFALRMGDTTLILGHRLSEWCGKAPILEEDIALANTALDLIGQTQLWLGLAGDLEGKGRDADRLAYFRDPYDFRCLLLVQLPNGDFADTIMRQFLFDTYHLAILNQLATGKGAAPERARPSTNRNVCEIAQKAVKEVTYQQERSTDLVIRLGDGTPESHAKMQSALNALWPYVGEMLAVDPLDSAMADAGIFPDPAGLAPIWHATVSAVLAEATLTIPDSSFAHRGGKDGKRHTEHLGHLLAVMQSLPRSHPDATW